MPPHPHASTLAAAALATGIMLLRVWTTTTTSTKSSSSSANTLSSGIALPPKQLRYRICVFCGSKSGTRPEYELEAIALGKAMQARGVELVYGGGSIGLMGTIANTVDVLGGIVHTVIPRALVKYTGRLIQEDRCIITRGMHDRKQCFHDLCDAFIALPGGLGTVEELMETATWAQLGVHNKPFGVLNVEDFYGPLRAMFAKQIADEFLDPVWQDGGLVFRDEAGELLDEILRLVDSNRASASFIPASDWV